MFGFEQLLGSISGFFILEEGHLQSPRRQIHPLLAVAVACQQSWAWQVLLPMGLHK